MQIPGKKGAVAFSAKKGQGGMGIQPDGGMARFRGG